MDQREYMFKEVETCLKSNQTQLSFSKGKEYSYDSLKYWIKQYRLANEEFPMIETQNTFREISLGSAPRESSKKIIELRTPSGFHIKIYE